LLSHIFINPKNDIFLETRMDADFYHQHSLTILDATSEFFIILFFAIA